MLNYRDTSSPSIRPNFAGYSLASGSYLCSCIGACAGLARALAISESMSDEQKYGNQIYMTAAWSALWCIVAGAAIAGILGGAISVLILRRRRCGMNYGLAALILGPIDLIAILVGTPMIDAGAIELAHSDRAVSCPRYLKHLGMAMMMYAEDSDGLLPPSSAWNHKLGPYLHNDRFFHCPESTDQTMPSYAMNVKLAEMRIKSVVDAHRTVLLFDSIPGWNLAGGPEILPSPPRHDGGHHLGFLDGHVKREIDANRIAVIWVPIPATKGKTSPVR